jgi:2-iminobutanoate/2-iminopropanoate deaminase
MLRRNIVDRAIKFADMNFNNAKSPYEAELFAKLALIEICGWIEEAMDEIIQTFSKNKLSDPSNIKYMENAIEKKHSFTYETHFRDLLIHCKGIRKIEQLEISLDQTRFQKMKSSLGQLKGARDKYAHTHVKSNTQCTLDAPSKLKNDFVNVYSGLRDIAVHFH